MAPDMDFIEKQGSTRPTDSLVVNLSDGKDFNAREFDTFLRKIDPDPLMVVARFACIEDENGDQKLHLFHMGVGYGQFLQPEDKVKALGLVGAVYDENGIAVNRRMSAQSTLHMGHIISIEKSKEYLREVVIPALDGAFEEL